MKMMIAKKYFHNDDNSPLPRSSGKNRNRTKLPLLFLSLVSMNEKNYLLTLSDHH